MNFGRIQYLWLLWLGPGLIAFYVWAFRSRAELIRAFVSSALAPRLLKGIVPKRLVLKAALLIGAVILIVLALTEPRWGFHWEEVSTRGVDIFVAIDLSKSMLAEDVAPTRLERAKHKIEDLTKIVAGDRLGLIAFSGKSFVPCPLTVDYGALLTVLDSLDTDTISTPGTAIAEAIDQSISSFDANNRKSRVLLLMTDGEDLEGDVSEAAKRAKQAGVRIYSMGIGKTSGAPIPNPEGGFKKDKQGEVILTKLDERSLESISVSTGGSYVHSVPGDEDLEQIVKDIHHEVEERELKGGKQKRYEERFQWPLAMALLFLLVESCVNAGKASEGENPWGRFFKTIRSFPGKGGAPILPLLCFLLASNVSAQVFSEDGARGQKEYDQGKFDKAMESFLNAQIEKPQSPELKYDLANSYYKMGKFAEAEKLFDAAAKLGGSDLKEKALYNLGNTAFRMNKLEEAMSYYQQALQLNPKDQDAQYNLAYVQKEKKKQQEEKQNQGQTKDQKDAKQGSKGKEEQSESQSQKLSKNDNEGKNGKKEASKQDSAEKAKEEEKAKKGEKQQDAENQKKKTSTTQGDLSKSAKNEAAGMSKDEAEQWLSRIKEEHQRADKDRKDAQSREVEKDW